MTDTRSIAVLTVGRSDFGRYRPVLNALKDDPAIDLRLLATGGHYSPSFGHTLDEIDDGGFNWEAGLEMSLDADTPAAVGKAIGLGTLSLAQAFAHDRPDLLVVLGDRFEMLAGANAALGFNIPVVHLHGGAVTEGAVDELVRHALTKMSHLHLVSCEPYAERVRQMGEEPWRVKVVGAPGLDELPQLAERGGARAARQVGLDLSKPTLLVCHHPVTLEADRGVGQVHELLAALDTVGMQTVITYPNVDPGSRGVIEALEGFATDRAETVRLLRNAGTELFVGLLSLATALVGNSSTGIVEAPTFRLPTVNIGNRQDGKVKAAHLIDTAPERGAIADAIRRAVEPGFRKGLDGLVNPYGDGKAGRRIADVLRTVAIDDTLIQKKFIDR